jgi:hypothetical protein
MYFNPLQMSVTDKAFRDAEKIAGRYFHLEPEKMKQHRYDVKTLAYLEDHEVRDGAFAHLCKYNYSKDEGNGGGSGDFHFYRICLQDNRILGAVERGHSFIKLIPLMMYIATHELVHIVRFDSGEAAFDAQPEEKEREEENVHAITRDILRSTMYPELDMVLECFSNRYKLGDYCCN